MNARKVSLTTAVTDGDTEAVHALLAEGSDVNKATRGGQTPIILAIVFRRTQILSLLLKAGADPYLRDGLGLNAVDWAERRGFTEGIKLLAQTGTTSQKTPLPPPDPITRNHTQSVSGQLTEQSPPTSTDSEQKARSDEKSVRWIAGLKKRFDEETSNKVNEVEAEPPTLQSEEVAEDRSKKVQPSVVVEQSTHMPEFEDFLEGTTKGELKTSRPMESNSESMTRALREPKEDEQTASAIASPSMSSSIKRCPKCKTIYNSELLWYCAIDMTPLVDGNKPMVAPTGETSGMPLIWVLVVSIFVAAGGTAYFLLPNSSQQNAGTVTSLARANDLRNLPVVGGELSGKQVNLPDAEYPESAKSAHVSGAVTVEVTVDKTGSVIATKVIEGDRRLRRAAITAARKATFSSEKLMGRGAVGTIVYTFRE